MRKLNNFDNVLYIDIFLLCVHLLATFVIFNRFMFVTIGVIRIPRLGLHILHSIVKKPEQKSRVLVWMHNFRLATVFLFPIGSVLVQLAIIFRMFCNKYGLESLRNHCYVRFGATMAGLILIHTLIDAFIYSIVRKKAFNKETLPKAAEEAKPKSEPVPEAV